MSWCWYWTWSPLAYIPVCDTLNELPLWEIYYSLLCFPAPFLSFAFVSSCALHQSVHILFALSSRFHFALFPPSLPLLPLCCSVPSALRLVSVLLHHFDSSSYSRDWNHHRQLVPMCFAPKARGDEAKCVWDVWCDETAGSPNALLTKCQHAHSISPFPLSFCLLSSDLHHHCCSFVWLPKGEWGIQLEWGILPIVFLSLRNIWVPD